MWGSAVVTACVTKWATSQSAGNGSVLLRWRAHRHSWHRGCSPAAAFRRISMPPKRALHVRLSFLCATLAVASACGTSSTEPKWHDEADLRTNRQEIIGGTLDSSDPAV